MRHSLVGTCELCFIFSPITCYAPMPDSQPHYYAHYAPLGSQLKGFLQRSVFTSIAVAISSSLIMLIAHSGDLEQLAANILI